MSTESGDPSVNGSSGNGAVRADATSGVTAELKNEIQKVVMGIFREQVPRAVKAAVSESVPELLKTVLGDVQQPKPDPAQSTASAAPAGNPADGDKITQKSRIEALERQLQALTQKNAEAEARAKDATLRSRVQTEVAKFLPANDPNHAAYMGLLYDLQKRFGEVDGSAVVKFKRDWGEEPVPLEQGVKELFESELKHLVQHSKAQQLPPTNYRGANGQPLPQRANGPAPRNPLAEAMARHYGALGEHHMVDTIDRAFNAPAGTNGTSTK